MPITLAIHGRPSITVGEEEISLGSDPNCLVSFADVEEIKPNHAVIREIGGKWLIEAREADSLIVGDAKPARVHYLKPGDVIRLTENSPPVTFQPIDDFLPLPDGPDASSMRLLLDDEDRPSSGSNRTSKPPTSGTIPAAESGSAGKTGTGKPPSSSTIPVTKPPSSSTMRSVKSSTDLASPAKRPDAKTTSQGAKRPGSSGQVPVRKPMDDEVEAGLPTLRRTSSWDDLPETPRRRRSSDQDEMQWIMMIVGRCAAAGLALLVLWLLMSFLWKALSQPSVNGPPTAIDQQNQETPVSNVAPVPTTVQPPPRPKLASTDNAPPVKVSSKDETSEDAATSEMKEKDPVDDGNSMMDVDSDPSMTPSVEKATPNGDSDDASMSPLLQATADSLYAIVIEDAAGNGQCQIGTAWAVSNRHLVTAASVAMKIDKYRKQNRTVVAIHPTSKQTFPIQNVRVHINYKNATLLAEEAADLSQEKKFAAAQKTQLRYNLGVLDVNAAHGLESPLPLLTRSLRNTREASFAMVGFPFDNEEEDSPNALTYKSDVIGPLKERRSKKLAAKMGTSANNNKELGITIQYGSTDEDWSGCPILNKDHKVIGVYGELTQPKGTNGKRPQRERGVAWIGYLNEVAQDIGIKTEYMKRSNDD